VALRGSATHPSAVFRTLLRLARDFDGAWLARVVGGLNATTLLTDKKERRCSGAHRPGGRAVTIAVFELSELTGAARVRGAPWFL